MADSEWDKYKKVSEDYYYLNTQSFTLVTCGITNKILEKTFDMSEKTMSSKKDKVQMVKNYGTHRLVYNPDTSLQITPPTISYKLIVDEKEVTALDKKLVELMNKNVELMVNTTTGTIKETFSFLELPNKREMSNLKVEKNKAKTFITYQYRGNLVTERIEGNMKYIASEDIYSRVVLRHEIEFDKDVNTNKLYPKRIVTKYDASGRIPVLITTMDYHPVRLTNSFAFPKNISAGLENSEPIMVFTFNNCFGT